MLIPEKVACDVCQRERTETNHYWLIWQGDDSILRVKKFGHLYESRDKHACGEQHVLELVSRWLRTGTLESEK